jgi:hypothetical protein
MRLDRYALFFYADMFVRFGAGVVYSFGMGVIGINRSYFVKTLAIYENNDMQDIPFHCINDHKSILTLT